MAATNIQRFCFVQAKRQKKASIFEKCSFLAWFYIEKCSFLAWFYIEKCIIYACLLCPVFGCARRIGNGGVLSALSLRIVKDFGVSMVAYCQKQRYNQP